MDTTSRVVVPCVVPLNVILSPLVFGASEVMVRTRELPDGVPGEAVGGGVVPPPPDGGVAEGGGAGAGATAITTFFVAVGALESDPDSTLTVIVCTLGFAVVPASEARGVHVNTPMSSIVAPDGFAVSE